MPFSLEQEICIIIFFSFIFIIVNGLINICNDEED